ncbi:MAG TPA: flagellar basal-body rod protein FlgG, partial [Deltaproteobacteria bacterium]|nr:flagellar basal-body rod protein FlgG [Deltaproteobacteria bacterium]
TGMSAQEMLVNTIANNLANVNTTGFKRSRVDFEDLFYATYTGKGSQTTEGGTLPVGIEVGMGVRPVAIQKIFTQGDYMQTGNSLDLAIEGKGFFKILADGEEGYTRDGSFKIDSEGYIVNSRGERLQPEFTVPPETATITVSKTGVITCLSNAGDTLATGNIPIYIFPNPSGLRALGMNQYAMTPASGDAIEGTPGSDNFGTISSGYLEMSNVDAVEEMVNMIAAQRAYELNSKSIKASDDMLQTVTGLVR